MDLVGRRVDIRARAPDEGTKPREVLGVCWVVSEEREERRRKTAGRGQRRGLYTPPKQRRARTRALPNAGTAVT